MNKNSDSKTASGKERADTRYYVDISNVCGGITDEEFADEFLAYPATPGTDEAKYQFNFLGAQLEKINSAQNVKDELKKDV